MGQTSNEDEQYSFLPLFRGMLEAAPDPTLIVASDGRIIFSNVATATILGWTPDAIHGQRVECLIPSRFRHDHARQRGAYAAKPLMRVMGAGRELTALRVDGQELPVEISLNPVPGTSELFTICILRDISERKRVERTLRDLTAHLEERVAVRTTQLQAANRELEMLAYSIAHDLRAPLRAINGFATQAIEAIQSDTNADANRCLQVVVSRASQINSMIDDYLRLLASGRKELSCERLDMQEIAQRAVAMLGEGHAKHITIDTLPAINADRGLMLEVWLQLLRNAVKFSANSAPPAISVTATEDQHRAYFHVADNGVGFDPGYTEKLFRVFERLHSAQEFPGNGIGLCLVKSIVDRHGGGIDIAGIPNNGARTTFWLPKPSA